MTSIGSYFTNQYSASARGARHRHRGQLEHDVATMAHDPGTELDQLLAALSSGSGHKQS
jgi:hypothetical protein